MDTSTPFKALVVEKTDDGRFVREIRERRIADLPPGDLVVRVNYSSLNYKDALSATGHPGVTRQFPHTPGIDAAGEVLSCEAAPLPSETVSSSPATTSGWRPTAAGGSSSGSRQSGRCGFLRD